VGAFLQTGRRAGAGHGMVECGARCLKAQLTMLAMLAMLGRLTPCQRIP